MKKLLEGVAVFNAVLRVLAFMGQRRVFNRATQFVTTQAALLNVALNKPGKASTPEALAQKWQQMMPPKAKHRFPIKTANQHTAIIEIHVHCPLRGTGNPHACHRLMNYDRKLMEKVGGQLVVLDSQSNSGKPYCTLAIRPQGQPIDDLVPAHKKAN